MSMPIVFLFSRKVIEGDDIMIVSIALGVNTSTRFITPKNTSDTIEQSMSAIENSHLIVYKDDEIQNLYCFGGDNLQLFLDFLKKHDQSTRLVDAMEEYIRMFMDS